MATKTAHETLFSFRELCTQITDRTGRKFTPVTWRYLLAQQKLDSSTFQRIGTTLLFRPPDVDRVEAAMLSIRKYKTATPEAPGATS